MHALPYQRILIIGSPGSGKSTLGHRLAQRLQLPLHRLDDLFWGEDWQPTPAARWREILTGLLAQDRWIIDGNYLDSLPQRLRSADAVIFLDVSPWLCLARVLRRAWRARRDPRHEPTLPARIAHGLAAGKSRVFHRARSFLLFVLLFRLRQRPKIRALLRAHPCVRVHPRRGP